jgi:glycosyltransferase involved in cell wall biosynthesis
MKNKDISRKRIAIVATTAKMVRFFLVNHIVALSKEYDVTVICNFSGQDDSLDILPSNVEVHNIPIKRNIDILSDFRSLLALTVFFYRKDFSVTYSISPKGGFLCAISAWFIRVPVRVHTFTGQVWATKKGLKRCFLKYFDRIISTISTIIIVDSPSQKNFLESQNVVKKNKALVIGYGSISGVDVKIFHSDKSVRDKVRLNMNVQDSSIVFLFVGRLKKDKGVFELAESFSNVCDKIPNTELWFVGDDEENVKHELNFYISTKGCNIKFIAYTISPEKYMKAADVFCLPSYREGFGTSIIEAASCGIPSIGTNIYGIIDAIVDNKTGLLVDIKNINSLTLEMLKMAKNHSLRKKMGSAAAKNAFEKFNSNRITDELLLILKDNIV